MTPSLLAVLTGFSLDRELSGLDSSDDPRQFRDIVIHDLFKTSNTHVQVRDLRDWARTNTTECCPR